MAMARPVIASLQAAAGVDARAGEEILVAANAEEFILHASRVLQQHAPATLGANARERVLRDYDWGTNLAGIEALLDPAADETALPIAIDARPAGPPEQAEGRIRAIEHGRAA